MYKVFLVDDEPFILEGLKNIINWKEYGFELTGQATNGLDALKMLETEKVDILITDITMPKMNGLELIKQLRSADSNTRFIVLSGYTEFEYVKQGIALGIENYLVKPVNVQELLSTLAGTCEKIESSRYKEINVMGYNNILRDNILYRWATNRIDAMELRERSQILHISLEYNYYVACVIHAISAGAEYFPLAFEWDASHMCFSNPDGDIILVFGINDAVGGRSFVQGKLEEILAAVESVPGLDIFITTGDYQPGFANLHKSYCNAKKMQEYRLISPKCRIVHFDEARNSKESCITNVKVDYQQFSKLLLSRDKDAVFTFIRSVFGSLKGCTGITPSQVQNCCMEMVIHINNTLETFDYNMIGNDYKELFFSMIEMHTIDQLESLVRNIADNAICCFITGDNKVSPVIRQVLKYVNNHYTDEVSLKTLGYELNVNPVYLGQLFQKEMGQLFNVYVNQFKLRKAEQLLLNTNLKAIDISRKVGFSDPNYFFRQFKKYAGVSPTELRTCKNSGAV